MGLCLSCLGSNQTTQEEENDSLLFNDKAKAIEDELLTELRNRQLNAILNSTNDHLIDISNMKLMSNYGSTSLMSTGNTNIDNDDTNSQLPSDENDFFKVVPISNSVIQNELDDQFNDLKSKYDEKTIRKCLTIDEQSLNNNDQKFTVDFI